MQLELYLAGKLDVLAKHRAVEHARSGTDTSSYLLELEHRMPMLLTERAFARLYILYVHSATIYVLKKVQSH